MNKLLSESEKESLKALLPEYLARHGIQLQKSKNLKCFFGTHEDNNPSMGYNENGHYLHCFSCGETADIFRACEILEKLPKGQGINRIKEIYGYGQNQPKNRQNAIQQPSPAPEVKDYRDFILKSHDALNTSDYHALRGLSEEVAERFKLGYADRIHGMTKALVIPMQREDGTYTYQLRNTSDTEGLRHYKPKVEEAGEAVIFNAGALRQCERPVAIVEGAIDALSLITAGLEAVALNGAQNKDKLMRLLKGRKLPPLILSLDNDEAGKRAQAEIIELFKANKIKYHALNLASTYKDANEALTKAPDRFKEFVSAFTSEKRIVAYEYLQNTVGRQLQDFCNFVSKSKKPAISTGFEGIDRMLNGGLREGLYCIGAISSLGKTTLALQIMDNIAKQGHDVLIFSLEMSGNELRAKSVSRESAILSKEQTSFFSRAVSSLEVLDKDLREGKDNEVIECLNDAYKNYKDYARRVFIWEAVGRFTVNDIRKIVTEHQQITGRAPVVLIDYLQIIQTSDPRLSDKQKVSYDVLTLKQISRDFKTPVIVISSFNRESYSRQATFSSFKESGDIEYSADALIALQLSVLKELPSGIDMNQRIDEALHESPRRVDVCFIKNRYGETGYCPIEASLKFNYFSEPQIISSSAYRKKSKK